MGTTRTLPRYTVPANVELGDTIRVIWDTGDVHRTVEGVVHTRTYEGSVRVFKTRDGQELLRWHPELKTKIVTLLIKKAEVYQGETLLEFFEQEGIL